jgi:hypothetical protein
MDKSSVLSSLSQVSQKMSTLNCMGGGKSCTSCHSRGLVFVIFLPGRKWSSDRSTHFKNVIELCKQASSSILICQGQEEDRWLVKLRGEWEASRFKAGLKRRRRLVASVILSTVNPSERGARILCAWRPGLNTTQASLCWQQTLLLCGLIKIS